VKRVYAATLWIFLAGAAMSAIPDHPSTVTHTAYGRYERYTAVSGPDLTPRDVVVFVPEGVPSAYGYAVLYMHDAQNLFDPNTSMAHEPWAVDQATAEGRYPLMIVAIDNTAQRWPEYMPTTAYDAWPESLKADALGKQSPPIADRYVDFLAGELKTFIDSHYPTRRDAAHTFIAGSSMGGLVSVYAMERHPEVYGRAAGLSTHWPSTTNFALYGQGPASADPKLSVIANTTVDTLVEHLPDPAQHRLWVDYGDQTLDQFYAPYAERFKAYAQERGWGSSLTMRFYPGASHAEPSWRARFPDVLAFFFAP
jgi:enterochelin esterase-like enzyme